MQFKQQGSVLLVSLVFLLLLTIAGVSAMNVTSLEERMAGNYRDQDLAFQAAESALLEAEQWIASQSRENLVNAGYTNPACSGTFCFSNPGQSGLHFHGEFQASSTPASDCTPGIVKEWEIAGVWDWGSSSAYRVADSQLEGTVGDARYIIEFRCFMAKDASNPTPELDDFAQWTPAYRITALASGKSTNSQVMLQSVYKKIN
jgi:type IV pilus assembly protein PilX